MNELILASKSPRRIELIERLGVKYRIQSEEIDETFDPKYTVEANVMAVALKKAEAVFSKLDDNPERVVLGVDTIVVHNGEVLTKPLDRKEAIRMIQSFSGNTHRVISGVALISNSKKFSFNEESYVTFIKLSEEEIEAYCNTNEPYDKAGAYGIQGIAGSFVSSIEGCYYNIMGFPLSSIYQALRDEFGFMFDWE